MNESKVQKLAGVLNVLVALTLAVNILAIILIPTLVRYGTGNMLIGAQELVESVTYPGEDDIVAAGIFGAVFGWIYIGDMPEAIPLCLFFLGCGLCTAVILRQARRILDVIQEGQPFRMENAKAMRRAALCCWGISALALGRLVLDLARHGSMAPLFTYNALFVPGFFMAGLLFLVMSALFRQAAELQEDQDLTI